MSVFEKTVRSFYVTMTKTASISAHETPFRTTPQRENWWRRDVRKGENSLVKLTLRAYITYDSTWLKNIEFESEGPQINEKGNRFCFCHVRFYTKKKILLKFSERIRKNVIFEIKFSIE